MQETLKKGLLQYKHCKVWHKFILFLCEIFKLVLNIEVEYLRVLTSSFFKETEHDFIYKEGQAEAKRHSR
jgi:hypothetical protein